MLPENLWKTLHYIVGMANADEYENLKNWGM
jgi:hypothetical protein